MRCEPITGAGAKACINAGSLPTLAHVFSPELSNCSLGVTTKPSDSHTRTRTGHLMGCLTVITCP